ncbi:MAG: aminodeoxychorismate/anthranilate synthase component II [Bacteroidetes bacterium]|nr:aminodeoxychorismate/anthranilate synthase component II [Bacteroidota bacterium]
MKNLLLIDNFDSFTYILRHYLELSGTEVKVVRNNESVLLDQTYIYAFDGLVFSPGPGTPKEAGYMLPLMEKYINQKAILGVCLGHQALGISLGASLVHAVHPYHGVESEIAHTGHDMFAHIPKLFKVGRYHSLTLDQNEKNDLFEVTAQTLNGEIMAIAHRTLLAWGIQFHPESCMTENGLQMIKNWVNKLG